MGFGIFFGVELCSRISLMVSIYAILCRVLTGGPGGYNARMASSLAVVGTGFSNKVH